MLWYSSGSSGILSSSAASASRSACPRGRGRADHRFIAIVTYHLPFGFNWESRGIEYPLFWALVVLHFLDARRRPMVD